MNPEASILIIVQLLNRKKDLCGDDWQSTNTSALLVVLLYFTASGKRALSRCFSLISSRTALLAFTVCHNGKQWKKQS